MADVGGQEDVATVDLTASSSVMEASCVVPTDAVGGNHGCPGEDEDHITCNNPRIHTPKITTTKFLC